MFGIFVTKMANSISSFSAVFYHGWYFYLRDKHLFWFFLWQNHRKNGPSTNSPSEVDIWWIACINQNSNVHFHFMKILILYHKPKINRCHRCVLHVSTPQPSGLKGYCHHGLGRRVGDRAGGCLNCGIHISVTAGQICSIQSFVELSRPVAVHCYGYLPICPIWTCPRTKNFSIWHKLGPYFAEHVSLKLLDGFTPFKVSWTCLDP